MSEGPLLSVFLGCRNDDYMSGSTHRLCVSLDSMAAAFESLGMLDALEILICDWGSDVPLCESGKMDLSDRATRVTKFIVVPPDFARTHSSDSPWPEPLIRNTCIRRASGRYLVSSNGDILFTPKLAIAVNEVLHLASESQTAFDREPFLYCSRRDIPYEIASQNLPAADFATLVSDEDTTLAWVFEPVPPNLMGPIGDFQLMARDRWMDMRGFDERLLYWGWMDIDLALRATLCCTLLDLSEVGAEMYHLEHYPAGDRTTTRRTNPQVRNPYRVNLGNPDWGFDSQDFPIVSVRLA
ncbi:MAG: hypothetical protein U1E22_01135 [Coriobacteriia bacterium]|nr:hypothetical protein [Coriobacteriia bacterium]